MLTATTTYIGVDPGKSGAVGIIYPWGNARVIDIPESLHSVLQDHVLSNNVRVILEMPDARPGKGIRDFIFGAGRLAGVCDGMGVPVILISAATWKPNMELSRKNKTPSLALARELWPELAPLFKREKDHNRAEALLLAEYGRRHGL